MSQLGQSPKTQLGVLFLGHQLVTTAIQLDARGVFLVGLQGEANRKLPRKSTECCDSLWTRRAFGQLVHALVGVQVVRRSAPSSKIADTTLVSSSLLLPPASGGYSVCRRCSYRKHFRALSLWFVFERDGDSLSTSTLEFNVVQDSASFILFHPCPSPE